METEAVLVTIIEKDTEVSKMQNTTNQSESYACVDERENPCVKSGWIQPGSQNLQKSLTRATDRSQACKRPCRSMVKYWRNSPTFYKKQLLFCVVLVPTNHSNDFESQTWILESNVNPKIDALVHLATRCAFTCFRKFSTRPGNENAELLQYLSMVNQSIHSDQQ